MGVITAGWKMLDVQGAGSLAVNSGISGRW